MLEVFRRAFTFWSDDKAPRLAAALSYYTVFSLAPLLLLTAGIAGLVMGADVARERILQQVASVVGPQGANTVQTLMGGAKSPEAGAIATIVGIVTLLLGSCGVVAQLKDALNSVWDVQMPKTSSWWDFARTYLVNFGLVVATGFLLLVSLLVTAAIGAVTQYAHPWFPEWMWFALDMGIGLVMTSAIFALIFKTMPDTDVRWSDVWLGSIVTAVLFTIGRVALGWYLGRESADSAYQATGAVLALFAWVYYSAQLVLFGAEFTYAYAQRTHERSLHVWKFSQEESMRQITLVLAGCAIAATIGCNRADKNSPVATNSPSGSSTAPSSAQAEARDNALVRVVDATPEQMAIDLYADQTKVFDNLEYKAVTPYREIDGQRYSFAATRAGGVPDAQALAKNSEGLYDGDYYTVFILPSDGNSPMNLRVVNDDPERPDNGKARVRVVNAMADRAEVDVFAPNANRNIVGGVDAQAVTRYHEIDPITGDLEVRKSGETTPMSKIANSQLEAGKSYTVVLIGHAKGRPGLDAFLIEDELKAPTTASGPVPR